MWAGFRQLQDTSIPLKSVFPANPSPVKLGTGCQRKWGRDTSFAVKIPDHPNQTQWPRHIFKRNRWVLVSIGVSDNRDKDVRTKPPGGVHLAQAMTTQSQGEARWGLKVPAALSRPAYIKADILIGCQSVQVLMATNGPSGKKKEDLVNLNQHQGGRRSEHTNSFVARALA